MLCHEVKVDESIWKEFGMDGAAVTAAYRKSIIEELKKLVIRGFVAERKGLATLYEWNDDGLSLGATHSWFKPLLCKTRCVVSPRKWDGTRVLGISADELVLQNRHGVVYTIRLPEIAKALRKLPGVWIVDSEVVFIDPKTGEELFTPCQRRCATQFPDWMLRDQFPVKMEAFDLLQMNGESLERKSYFARKELLSKLLANNEDPTLEYVPNESDLLSAWAEAVDRNREGLIVKNLDSAYEHTRSYSWLKVKNWRFIDCDIVGFTPGENARSSFFGSLVLAREGKYIGNVGSGFNEWELRKMKDTLFDRITSEEPFSYGQVGEPYQAVDVKMQALVKYYQTTDAGVMRFPVFITSS